MRHRPDGRVKAPFPWFGGKRRVADVVWTALGDVANYVEPFAGSLAVLLERPGGQPGGGHAETVNDADRYVTNFWRALAADPDAVAHHAQWPVNESDLTARHSWLVNEGRARVDRLEADPDWYDPKVAGWWVWGINSWIGSGWCSGTGPWTPNEDRTTLSQLPHLGAGQGINRQLPHLGAGRGINRQRPHLGDAGRGTQSTDFTKGGSGAPAVTDYTPGTWGGDTPIHDYLLALSARLFRVRVCCGDWSRVVTDGALSHGSTVGVFLDPPYLGDVRTADLYSTDDHTIAHEVREWAVAHGDDPKMRIVLAGYLAEHDDLMPTTWRRHRWSAGVGYGTAGQTAAGHIGNRHNECLWISPHCINPETDQQLDLFGGV